MNAEPLPPLRISHAPVGPRHSAALSSMRVPRTGYLAVSLLCPLPNVIALLGLSGRRRTKEVPPPLSR